MRVGVFLLAARFPGQSDEQVLSATVEAAAAAERAGFDDVWLAEHHFMSYGICPSAVTLAGYLLGSTRRVAVGPKTEWPPWRLKRQRVRLLCAKETASRRCPRYKRSFVPCSGLRLKVIPRYSGC